ncbi:hypothetical protein ACLHDG_08180 [Sulfurovum sp. CS9]|uniref:hypothetical protein n=1 Tax=Sulfurovum sp. CS9 TaxID=3391146 RepID=UPI0039EBC425
MKTLLITLLLAVPLFAETATELNKTPSLMECEMIIEMFNFSIGQGNPLTKEQINGVIEACDGQVKHQKTIDTMKKLLGTIEEK